MHNNEPTLDELKSRSAKMLNIMAWLLLLTLFSISIYTIENNGKQITKAYDLFSSMKTEMQKNAANDLEQYIVTNLTDCMRTKVYHNALTLHKNFFFTLNDDAFKQAMAETRNECAVKLENKTVLQSTRGIEGPQIDKNYADRIKTMLATNS